jgi:hypothetical protein
MSDEFQKTTQSEGSSTPEEKKKDPPMNLTIDYNIMSVALNISTAKDIFIYNFPPPDTSPLKNMFNNRATAPPTGSGIPTVPNSTEAKTSNDPIVISRSTEGVSILNPSVPTHTTRVVYKPIPGIDDILYEKKPK